MSTDEKAVERLCVTADIRELAELYARGSDRRDITLLRTLYTRDAIHVHAKSFNGPATDFLDNWEAGMRARRGTAAHYICSHLIDVEGDDAQGEARARAWHLVETKAGQGYVEDFVGVRYLDIYRKENGFWRFAKRQATIEFRVERTLSDPERKLANPLEDLSYKALTSKLFALGGPRC